MIKSIRELLHRGKETGATGETYLVVGLGNPEAKYDGTRHNAGFAVVDRVAENASIALTKTQCQALTGTGRIEGAKVLLAKPMTYMNLSGNAVRALTDYYKIDVSTRLIVISDEIYLDLGTIRIRAKGSDGGHNGLKHIIGQLGTDQFIRVRVGVGEQDKAGDMIGHVLGKPSPAQRAAFEEGIARAASAVGAIIRDGVTGAMNVYNAKRQSEQ